MLGFLRDASHRTSLARVSFLMAAIAALALTAALLTVPTTFAFADETLENSQTAAPESSLLVSRYSATVSGSFNQTEARKLLSLVNAARAARGVAPLTWDSNMENVAMTRALEITHSFSHNRPNGSECFTLWPSSYKRAYGENIAEGQMNTNAVNTSWTNSTVHYQNMMDPDFKCMGAACFVSSDGTHHWVEAFSGAKGNSTNAGVSSSTSFAVELKPLPYSDVTSSDWAYYEGWIPYVTSANLMGSIGGTTEFRPNAAVTRGMVITVLYRAATGHTVSNTNNNVSSGFVDVARGQWYTAAVQWGQRTGIVTGDPKTKRFNPDANITREDLATILSRYAAWKKSGGTSTEALASSASALGSFHDSSAVSVYAKAHVQWCTANKVITGSNGQIRPKGTATRAEMAKMVTVVLRDIL